MPFDGRDNTPALNRARLIEALRQPIKNWDFTRFDRCACNVAKLIGLVTDDTDFEGLGEILGISEREAANIFVAGLDVRPSFYGVVTRASVTPAMVADALERIA